MTNEGSVSQQQVDVPPVVDTAQACSKSFAAAVQALTHILVGCMGAQFEPSCYYEVHGNIQSCIKRRSPRSIMVLVAWS